MTATKKKKVSETAKALVKSVENRIGGRFKKALFSEAVLSAFLAEEAIRLIQSRACIAKLNDKEAGLADDILVIQAEYVEAMGVMFGWEDE